MAIETDVTIVHLAIDFNTPQRPPTTTAIEWFVDELAAHGGIDNVVIALRRSPNPIVAPLADCSIDGRRIFHLPYFGLALGVGLLTSMRKAARSTIALLQQEGIRPDLIHAHKFTFEGLAAWYVARHFDVPLFLSLRGEVETKVFRMKPGLRPLLRRISADAARLYFVSAWFMDEFHRHVPAVPAKERLLPNIVRNITPIITTVAPCDAFVSIFNLDTRKRKGMRWLLDGVSQALEREPGFRLDIIGGGSAESLRDAKAMIAKRGLDHIVTLVGPLPNAEVLRRLPQYRALLLPSLNETFGMVYVEALFAGVPILYTAGTAIDGYLDGLDVGVAVPPKDVRAIAAGIVDLWKRSVELRYNIEKGATRLFETFDPGENIARYRNDVRQALVTHRLSHE